MWLIKYGVGQPFDVASLIGELLAASFGLQRTSGAGISRHEGSKITARSADVARPQGVLKGA